jgi:hypothetical protein
MLCIISNASHLQPYAIVFISLETSSNVCVPFIMFVSDFSFSDAKVEEGRFTEVVNAGSNLFHRSKAEYGHVWATFLASHIGFEDDEFEWEGVKPLGQGGFGMVGHWDAKNKEGSKVKVRNHGATL